MRALQAVSYLVEDYQQTIDWFTHCLEFVVLADVGIGDGQRFIRIAPDELSAFSLVLVKSGPSQQTLPGHQANGVFLFLQTDDFDNDYQLLCEKGVRFIESPRDEPYAKVVVFEDLYGNQWDLIQPNPNHS